MTTNAERYDALPLSAFAWPITCHYRVVGLWGTSHQNITLDVPALTGLPEESAEFARLLWQSLIAPAMTLTTLMAAADAILWKADGALALGMGPMLPGSNIGSPADKGDSACLMFHSGHKDSRAMTPFYWPGIPRRWTEAGLLTDVGMRALEFQAHVMVQGMMGNVLGGPLTLLNYFFTPGDEAGQGGGELAFRRVQYIRVNRQLERAPDYRSPLDQF